MGCEQSADPARVIEPERVEQSKKGTISTYPSI
jgi:hypothetical protein